MRSKSKLDSKTVSLQRRLDTMCMRVDVAKAVLKYCGNDRAKQKRILSVLDQRVHELLDFIERELPAPEKCVCFFCGHVHQKSDRLKDMIKRALAQSETSKNSLPRQ